MLLRCLCLTLAFAVNYFYAFTANAQIVNVLSELAPKEENGLSGEIDAGFNWKTGNTEQLTLTGGIGSRFRYDDSSIFLIWKGKYASAGDLHFEQCVMTHLRYRYSIRDWLSAEVFGQHEYNEFRRLQRRDLGGLGPRFRLLAIEQFALSVGVAYMIENEELDDAVNSNGEFLADAGEVSTNHRLSSYLSLSGAFLELLKFDGTIFFQPRLDEFEDFRILAELSMSLSVTDAIAVGVSGGIVYDSTPPIGVEEMDAMLLGKLAVRFGTIPI